MNIRCAYRQWSRKRKYKKVTAGIDKLNKMADDIARSIPVELDMSSLVNLMVAVVYTIHALKFMAKVPLLSWRFIRRRSRLFFWR